ncbi:MAG: NAD-dependent epimerase/dehydratase family protein [Dehalococcoidia bacterium]
MRCLVTGGTGFIGSHLVEALLDRGAEVVCLVRPTSDRRWIAATRAEVRCAGLDDPAAIARHLDGVTHVCHVAGAIAARSAAEFDRVNCGLTRAVLTACASVASPPRLLYVSSLAAAGPSRPSRPVTEDDPPHPVSAYGRSKLRAEGIVRGFAGRVPFTIVRPPVVYGPRDQALLTVFRVIARRLRPRLSDNRFLSLISVGDLVQGLVRVLESDAAVGRTYFLTYPQPLSLRALGEYIAEALGVRALGVPAPDPLVLAAGAAAQFASGLIGRVSPFNLEKAREMTMPGWVCDGRRARDELGFQPSTTHEVALRTTAHWYREQGWL